MPFLRFSRDKRGYEHTYLVQATNRRGKAVRPRVLYWYRTPPGVRLGRVPFDEDVRRALEAQNPGIAFDWNALANTPFPSQEPEFWRERRRAEKAAKQALREEEASAADVEPDERPLGAGHTEVDAATGSDVAVGAQSLAPQLSEDRAASPDLVGGGGSTEARAARRPDETASDSPRKRRRRGGRRRQAHLSPRTGAGGSGQAVPSAGNAVELGPDAAASEPGDSSSEGQE